MQKARRDWIDAERKINPKFAPDTESWKELLTEQELAEVTEWERLHYMTVARQGPEQGYKPYKLTSSQNKRLQELSQKYGPRQRAEITQVEWDADGNMVRPTSAAPIAPVAPAVVPPAVPDAMLVPDLRTPTDVELADGFRQMGYSNGLAQTGFTNKALGYKGTPQEIKGPFDPAVLDGREKSALWEAMGKRLRGETQPSKPPKAAPKNANIVPEVQQVAPRTITPDRAQAGPPELGPTVPDAPPSIAKQLEVPDEPATQTFGSVPATLPQVSVNLTPPRRKPRRPLDLTPLPSQPEYSQYLNSLARQGGVVSLRTERTPTA